MKIMNVINENVIIFLQTEHLSFLRNLFLHYVLFFCFLFKIKSKKFTAQILKLTKVIKN
jgi:hypothetical protein